MRIYTLIRQLFTIIDAFCLKLIRFLYNYDQYWFWQSKPITSKAHTRERTHMPKHVKALAKRFTCRDSFALCLSHSFARKTYNFTDFSFTKVKQQRNRRHNLQKQLRALLIRFWVFHLCISNSPRFKAILTSRGTVNRLQIVLFVTVFFPRIYLYGRNINRQIF